MARPVNGRRWKQRIFWLLGFVQQRSLKQVDIQVSIAIVVEECSSCSHDLRHKQLPGSPSKVLELQSEFGSRISEKWFRRRLGRGRGKRKEEYGKGNDGERPRSLQFGRLPFLWALFQDLQISLDAR